MKSILKSAILAFALLFTQSAVPAKAASSQPLMVIRFTNAYVDYQNSLSMAVSSAVKAKKNVVFDVVAGRQVGMMGNQVAREIMRMGVEPVNVNLKSSGINNNEVLIFVR